jgi:hypothetical protein
MASRLRRTLICHECEKRKACGEADRLRQSELDIKTNILAAARRPPNRLARSDEFEGTGFSLAYIKDLAAGIVDREPREAGVVRSFASCAASPTLRPPSSLSRIIFLPS